MAFHAASIYEYQSPSISQVCCTFVVNVIADSQGTRGTVSLRMSTPPGVLLRDDDFSNKAPPASNVKERASCFMHTDLTPTTRTDLARHGARWQHRPPSDRVATHEARSMHAMTTSAFATPHRCGSSTRCHRVRRRCPAHQGRRQRRHRRSCCAVLGAGTDVGSRALRPPLGWATCYCNSRPARPVASIREHLCSGQEARGWPSVAKIGVGLDHGLDGDLATVHRSLLGGDAIPSARGEEPFVTHRGPRW